MKYKDWFHVYLLMSGIDLLMSCRLGESVLRIAHKILTVKMKTNSRYGNKKGVGRLMNIERWNDIDHPTIVPINTPLKLLATTNIKAS